jgi:6-phosphogluconolactonase
MLEFNEFQSRDEAANALARRIGQRLRAAAYHRAAASLIVDGDASPHGLFESLRWLPLPWHAVTVVPTDERWEPDDGEGPIRRELLSGESGFARFVSLYRHGQDAAECLSTLQSSLAELPRPFDVVVAGLGEDGHTAALFPGSPDLCAALESDAACLVQHVPRLGQTRVGLTVRSLLDSQEIDLLFYGTAKRTVYERALAPGPVEQYPIRALVHQNRVPVNVFWAP